MSEALIFASTNPRYESRLFIVHENCKLRIPAEHVVYTNCCFCVVLTFRTILVHNMLRASEKDLPVQQKYSGNSVKLLSIDNNQTKIQILNKKMLLSCLDIS